MKEKTDMQMDMTVKVKEKVKSEQHKFLAPCRARCADQVGASVRSVPR